MKKTSIFGILFLCAISFFGGLLFPERNRLNQTLLNSSSQVAKLNSVSSGEEVYERIMNYPMKQMIERCKKEHGYTDDDMLILEKELKRYFIMVVKSNFLKKQPTGMYSSHVDNLWHSFVLFTKEYNQFCLATAGYFIHHAPEIGENPLSPEEKRLAFRDFISTYEQTFKEEIHPIWLLDHTKI